VNERIRTNVAAIKDAYFTIASTPTLPSTLNKIDIAKANAIEKILFDIDNLLTYMESSFVYAGVGSCGQSRIWQRRFRLGKTHAEVKTWANIIKIYWNEFSETDTWEVFE
jgi:hypothetical protein